MAMMPWEPYQELTPLREAMNRLLEESFIGPRRQAAFGRSFPIDVREMDTEYVIEAALPGMQAKDMQVTAMENTVTIRATTKREEKQQQAGTYVRQERFEGEVTRSIMLPGPIDRDKITATYERGVLTLRVPKAEAAKSKTIAVQVKDTGAPH
jgi:HSP20 family protein